MRKNEEYECTLARVREVWLAYSREVAALILDQTGYWTLIGSMSDPDIREVCDGYIQGLEMAAGNLDDLKGAMDYEIGKLSE